MRRWWFYWLSRLLVLALFLLPWVATIGTALKSESELSLHPHQWWPSGWPWDWQWSNFQRCLEIVPMHLFTLNTLALGLACSLAHAWSCPLAAYAMLRAPKSWRRTFWAATVASYVVPFPALILGQYLLFHRLGWLNSYWPLFVPSLLGNPFFVIYLYGVFRVFPRDLQEAARMEGCSEWQILTRVILPNSKPALVTLVVLTIQGVWNDFLSPLMVLQEQSLFTVNLGLQFYRSAYQISWTQMMAASLLSTLPVIALFLVAQRSFVSGTLEGSDK